MYTSAAKGGGTAPFVRPPRSAKGSGERERLDVDKWGARSSSFPTYVRYCRFGVCRLGER